MAETTNKENLDALINNVSFEIAKRIKENESKNKENKLKNEIDKLIGVLSQDGVYAFYIYAKSKKMYNLVFKGELDKLKKYVTGDGNFDSDEKFYESLSDNLYNLLFFRDILDRVLTYVRYHLKAEG